MTTTACALCHGTGYRTTRTRCAHCDGTGRIKADSSAITRAVEAWREVSESDRREALEEIDTLISIASVNALGVVLERALRRAAALLRAAGGGS